MENKQCCTECGVEKPLTTDFFNRRPDSKLGWRRQCNVCYRSKYKEYYENNKTDILNQKYTHRKNNPEKRMASNRKYQERQRKNNPLVRVRQNITRSINGMLKGQRKSLKTENILGCNWIQLKEHLQKQFQPNMNWENYGKFGWHIDHIIPVSTAQNETELYKLNHYTNLQPLWWEDNIKKSNKISEEWGNI